MNENTQVVLNQLMTMALLKNKRCPERWGVLFGKYKDRYGNIKEDAYTAITFEGTDYASMLVRVSEYGDFGAPDEEPFYSFETNGWKKSPFGVTANEIRDKFDSLQLGHPFRVGTHTLLNFIQRRFNPLQEKELGRIPHVRAIIHRNRMQWENANLAYISVGENGEILAPKLRKQIRLSLLETESNPKGLGTIPPGAYYAEGFNEDADAVYYRVIKPATSGMGVAFYDCGKSYYKWKDDHDAYNFPAYNMYNSITFPCIPGEEGGFEPFSVQCDALYSALKDLFPAFPVTTVLLGPDAASSYIFLTGERDSVQGPAPLIECVLGVLRRDGSGWRC